MSEQKKREQIILSFVKGTSRRNRILWGNFNDALDLDITNAQRDTLIAIDAIKDCHISDIATWLGVTNGAVTQLVDGLEKNGVVRRQPDAHDARRVSVVITELGRKKLHEATIKYMRRFDDIFTNLSTQQLEVLIEMQDEILAYGQRQGFKI